MSSLKVQEINGRFYMPAKVVMLPTDEATGICTDERSVSHPSLLLYHKPNWQDILAVRYGYSQNYHLYFTSNEKIKKGFSGFAIVTVKDDARIKYLVEVIVTEDNQCYCKEDRKFSFEYYQINPIISTTDDSLGLPKPSSSFIKAYIEEYNKGNVITDVLVEYEFDEKVEGYAYSTLKVDSNNTITIKKVKDSWNYEEHCLDMQYYMEYCQWSGYVTPQEWINKYKHY